MILAIYGTGGLGRECYQLALQINRHIKKWEKIVFIDDFIKKKYICGCEIYNFETIINIFERDELDLIIGLGEPQYRNILAEKIKKYKLTLTKLIHPNVYVPFDSSIGMGSIIFANTSISTNIQLEDNVVIQPMSVISHDTLIGANSVISALVSIAGNCQLGKNVFVGTSAAIREKISIGNNSVIGMGTIVISAVGENLVVVGNPARIIKKNSGKIFE